MLPREQFDKLTQYARRDDSYINATEWCKHFGYDLSNWKRSPKTKARLESLKATESNAEPWIVERVGKTWVTWVHPIMAVHLASYLDPAFASYVAEIFIRYAKADPTLAADVASRQNTVEGLDIINETVQKQYSLILGRDWICETSKIKLDFFYTDSWTKNTFSEFNLVSLLNKKFGLPCERLVVILPFSEDTFKLVKDFLKDKYPNIYQSAYTFVEVGSKLYWDALLDDEIALFSYFIAEINNWVREKGGTDCKALR